MSRAPHLACFGLLLFLATPRADASEFDSNGVRLRYDDKGRGPAVVLLHGLAGRRRSWERTPLYPELSSSFRVVSLDLRGHGESDKPHRSDAYGAELAHDVVRLFDHLELERAHVVGYSLGGWITTKLLEVAPERIESAVLLAWGLRDMHPQPGFDILDRVAASLARGRGFGPLEEILAAPAPQNAEPRDPRSAAELERRILARNDTAALAALAHAFRGLQPRPSVLARSDVPLLALVGSRDGLLGDVRRLERQLSDAAVIVFEGASHADLLSRNAVAEEVVRFLRASGTDRGGGSATTPVGK